MATAAPPLQELKELFECPVCLEAFDDPRILPSCGHHFCLECIKKMYQPQSRSVTCPTCRAESARDSDLDSLPRPVMVNEIQERLSNMQILTSPIAKKGGQETKEKVCDACGTQASIYCYDCKECLCNDCLMTHQKEEIFSGHHTDNLSRVSFCAKHESQIVQRYCVSCSDVICTRCVMAGHRGHETQEVSEAAKRAKQKLVDWLGEKAATMYPVDSEQLHTKADEFVMQAYDTWDKSHQEVFTLKGLFEQYANRLNSELVSKFSDEPQAAELQNDIVTYRAKLEDWKANQEQVLDMTRQVMETATDAELLMNTKEGVPECPARPHPLTYTQIKLSAGFYNVINALKSAIKEPISESNTTTFDYFAMGNDTEKRSGSSCQDEGVTDMPGFRCVLIHNIPDFLSWDDVYYYLLVRVRAGKVEKAVYSEHADAVLIKFERPEDAAALCSYPAMNIFGCPVKVVPRETIEGNELGTELITWEYQPGFHVPAFLEEPPADMLPSRRIFVSSVPVHFYDENYIRALFEQYGTVRAVSPEDPMIGLFSINFSEAEATARVLAARPIVLHGKYLLQINVDYDVFCPSSSDSDSEEIDEWIDPYHHRMNFDRNNAQHQFRGHHHGNNRRGARGPRNGRARGRGRRPRGRAPRY